MNTSFFITTSGILTAVLLVWAQLWWRTYNEQQQNYASVGLGIFWSYLAVLISMVSFGWSAIASFRGDNSIPTPAVNLFIVALIIGALNVLQSIISVVIKLMKKANVKYSLLDNYLRQHLKTFTILSIIGGVAAFTFPFILNLKDVAMPDWEFWVSMLLPLAVAIIALIIALRDSPRIKRIENELTADVDLDIRWRRDDKQDEIWCHLSVFGDDLTDIVMELPYRKEIGILKKNTGFNEIIPNLKRGMNYKFTFKDSITLKEYSREGVIRYE